MSQGCARTSHGTPRDSDVDSIDFGGIVESIRNPFGAGFGHTLVIFDVEVGVGKGRGTARWG